jgi:hypothetical protein
MIMYRLLALTVLIPSVSCLASDFSTSYKVFLQGGVCADDPFSIVQYPATFTDGQPKYEFFAFSEECEALGFDRDSFALAPTSFVCHPGGKSVLSGTTYKKVKYEFIDNRDVHTYRCIKGCAHSPKEIGYTIGDCG